jgi:hypothetical protein
MDKRLLGVTVLVIALAGCAPSGGAGAKPDASASATVAPSPTPTPLTAIPPTAFLQPEDMGPGDVLTEGMVMAVDLNPCGGTGTGVDVVMAARKYVGFRYYFTGGSEPDGIGYEVITSYRAGGGEDYIAEVRDGLASRCARYENEDTIFENTIVAERSGGDDSVLTERRMIYKPNGHVSSYYSAAIRIGDVILFIEGPGRREHMDRIVAAALVRAGSLI